MRPNSRSCSRHSAISSRYRGSKMCSGTCSLGSSTIPSGNRPISSTLPGYARPGPRRCGTSVGGDRAEEAVHRDLGGATPPVRSRGEEEGVLRPSHAAVAEGDTPDTDDLQRLAATTGELTFERPRTPMTLVRIDLAAAEVGDQEIAAVAPEPCRR